MGGDSLGSDMDVASGLDDAADDQPSDNPDDYKDVDEDEIGGEVNQKNIQQLAGKLAYQMREFDDEDTYSDTAKFAMSMAVSALQTDKMSEEDMADIQKKINNKVEGGDEDSPEENPEENPEEDSNEDEIQMKDFSNESFVLLRNVIENFDRKMKKRSINEDMYAAPDADRFSGYDKSADYNKKPSEDREAIKKAVSDLLDSLYSEQKRGILSQDNMNKKIVSQINAMGGDITHLDLRILGFMHGKDISRLKTYLTRQVLKGKGVFNESELNESGSYDGSHPFDMELSDFLRYILSKRESGAMNTNKAANWVSAYISEKYKVKVDAGDIAYTIAMSGGNIEKLRKTVLAYLYNSSKMQRENPTPADLDEDNSPFNKSTPRLKNKRESQDWFGNEVGRYFGNDDAMQKTQDQKQFFSKLKNTKRNPFKY